MTIQPTRVDLNQKAPALYGGKEIFGTVATAFADPDKDAAGFADILLLHPGDVAHWSTESKAEAVKRLMGAKGADDNDVREALLLILQSCRSPDELNAAFPKAAFSKDFLGG